MNTFIGIDPGASGALAAVNGSNGAPVVLKFAKTTPLEWFRWLVCLRDISDTFAMIERVSAMPKQGVSSTFKFGYQAGMLEGFLIAAGIPFEFVRPQAWQAAMKCLSRGDKNVTKRAAERLFPNLPERITHATADALLIAEYCRRQRSAAVPQVPTIEEDSWAG